MLTDLTLGEIIDSHPWDDIEPHIRLMTFDLGYPEGYFEKAHNSIRQMETTLRPCEIRLRDDGSDIIVLGWGRYNEEADEWDESCEPIELALMLTDWSDWRGMRIHPDSWAIVDGDVGYLLALILFEMAELANDMEEIYDLAYQFRSIVDMIKRVNIEVN